VKSQIANRKSKIAIVGAGPAGSSLAIRLADNGFETVLIERKRFPRQKLCGEFISPECFGQFRALGVLDEMLGSGGDRIYETRFFEVGGRSVSVPSSWFGEHEFALSLSRAEMDDRLLERAGRAGVEVLQGVSIVGLESENGSLKMLKARDEDGELTEIRANVFVDATGRAGVLTKLAEKDEPRYRPHPIKPAIVGFKAHVQNARIAKGVCDIYSFPGGYAGLSNVENGLANLCFLIRSKIVRSGGGDAAEIVERVISKNKRAAEALDGFTPAGDWLAVSIDGFGTKSPAPAANLFTVGDAAAFIDPFTGSGMVMAFESSEVLADVMTKYGDLQSAVGEEYATAYRSKFTQRLRICSLLRRTAFMSSLASGIVASLRISSGARRLLARATRGG
jgi:flavin-dependent dehydrogenase